MILDQILAAKRARLPRAGDGGDPPPSRRSLVAHLKGRHHLIAEIKRRSPSEGPLGAIDVPGLVRTYGKYASAISVLTEETFFDGSLEDLRQASEAAEVPVLRKDFIIDAAQIPESRRWGADAILLLAAVLDVRQLVEFIGLAGRYGLDCLVEAHTEAEVEKALAAGAGIIGLNNRNLDDFSVDLDTTLRLKRLIPPDRIVVSESGIHSLADIARLGTHAVLVGTSLVRAADPAAKLASLRRPKVKICGITCPGDAAAAVRAGADYLGFNFHPASPRCVTPGQAAGIIRGLPNSVAAVGVFVDAPVDEVRDTARQVGLDLLQFHGAESPEYCREFDLPVIKAFRVADRRPDTGAYRVFGCLFDTHVPGQAGGTGRCFDWQLLDGFNGKCFLAGGITAETAARLPLDPFGLDACSGLESAPGHKDPGRVAALVNMAKDRTRFGRFGGRFVPETLMAALEELESAYQRHVHDRRFRAELDHLLRTYAGRPTPLYHARNFSALTGGRVFLKREDLLHGGAHKTNNVLGQVLLARAMGKRRIVAETGAGQHGIAVAMAAALFSFPAVVYMGLEDIARQRPNVLRMKLCGAEVVPVETAPGRGTLKDAISQALRDWTTNVRDTYYMLGSVAGPHPYPAMVRDFQKVIGQEARAQVLEAAGRLPDRVVACVGGGSNAIGIFDAFIPDRGVELVGVEAGGTGHAHGATLSLGSEGIFQGARTMVLQDEDGQIREAESVAAGLDYPGVGPQHAWLQETGRARYVSVTDGEALEAFRSLSRSEGIIPALESAHAVAWAGRQKFGADEIVIINLSGRGDKDLARVEEDS